MLQHGFVNQCIDSAGLWYSLCWEVSVTLSADLPVFNELTVEAYIHSKILKYLVYNNIHQTNKWHLVWQITQIIVYRCLMLLLIA